MKFRSVVLGCSLCAASAAFAASPEVRSVRIELELAPERGEITETAHVQVRGGPFELLHFELDPCLTFETVRSANRDSAIEGRRAGGGVEVRFDPPLLGDTTLTFRVSGRPRCGAGGVFDARGLALGDDDGWYPRLPGAIAESGIEVLAPASWTLLASGAPAAASNGRARFLSSKPLAGLGIAGGPGLVISEAPLVRDRLRVAGPPGSADATTLAPKLADAFSWLSGALSEYPFDGVHVVFLPGLERRVHGSGLLAVPAGTAIEGPQDGADLLALQWFGERVRGDGPWIQALAAWQAVTYARDRALPMPRDIAALREEYRSMDSSRESALSDPAAEIRDAVVRGRGSAAPDMVRLATGDRPWFAAIRTLAELPVGSTATLDDLRRATASPSGAVPPAFSEWFERAGIPRLVVTFRAGPAGSGGYRADVRIDQPGLVFHLPLELVFHGREGALRRETVELTGDSTVVYYLLDFEPLRLEVDPLGRWFQHPPTRIDR